MVLTRAAVTGLLIATLCLIATGAVWAMRSDKEERVVTPPPARAPVQVVHDWDVRRSAAWAAGDVEALERLYVPGSSVGRDDAAMLAAYAAKGLRVEGLQTQLLAVEEVRSSDDAMVLRVTDRVHAGTITGRGVKRSLPRDEVSVRRLTFRLQEGAWRVLRVVETSVGQAG